MDQNAKDQNIKDENVTDRYTEKNNASGGNTVKFAVISLLVLASLSFLLIIYNGFILTPEVRLINGYNQLTEKIDADYRNILKQMGLGQDFSKEFNASFTIDFTDAKAVKDSNSKIRSLTARWIQSDKNKFYQGLLSYKKEEESHPLFGIQIDDDNISFMLPRINSNVYTLSSKHFGKEFNQFSRNMRWYYSQYSEVDFSYSKLRKIFTQKYESRYILQRYSQFFREVFKNLNIKREGNVYTCVIVGKQLQEAIDNALNKAIEDFEDFDLYHSKSILEIMKYNVIKYLSDVGIVLETRLSDGMAKNFEIGLLYQNDEFIRFKFDFNSDRRESIFKDVDIEIYREGYENRVLIKNNFEEHQGTFRNTLSAKKESDVEMQSRIILEYDGASVFQNILFRVEDLYNGHLEDVFEMRGELRTSDDSFSLFFPGVNSHLDSQEKGVAPSSITLTVKKDSSDRWDFKRGKTEVKLIDMKAEEFDRLIEELQHKEDLPF